MAEEVFMTLLGDNLGEFCRKQLDFVESLAESWPSGKIFVART